MVEFNFIIASSLYILSLFFLGIRLRTEKKRDFLISVFFILLSSVYAAISLDYSVVNLFMLAMIFSFIGDLFMAEVVNISASRTIDGIIAFGIAHILYTIAFYQLSIGSWSENMWVIFPGLLIALLLYYFLAYNPKFHIAYKIANLIYSIIITSVFVMVLVFIMSPQVPILAILSALFGILLFMTSDGVLAYNEFKSPIKHAKEVIAFTYILGQILLQMTPILTFI